MTGVRRIMSFAGLVLALGGLVMTLAAAAVAAGRGATTADLWAAMPAPEIAAWIPSLTPAQLAPCPACSSTQYRWKADRPDEVTCARCGRVYRYDPADTTSIFSTNAGGVGTH